LRYPAKALGLVLSRPASLDRPNSFNQKMFALIAELIKTAGPEEGLRLFQQLPEFKEIERGFPDTAHSLSNQFKHPRAREMAAQLSSIPNDSPLRDIEQARSIACPTLILANKKDPIHPCEFGVRLAEAIPGAQFREIASKSVDLNQHLREVQQFLQEFLSRRFLNISK
jgi:pimeloyl-ACP methyl ester carboxylesterase